MLNMKTTKADNITKPDGDNLDEHLYHREKQKKLTQNQGANNRKWHSHPRS